MPRFLVKVNTRNKTIEHVRLPKGVSLSDSRIHPSVKRDFKGLKPIQAKTKNEAVNIALGKFNLKARR